MVSFGVKSLKRKDFCPSTVPAPPTKYNPDTVVDPLSRWRVIGASHRVDVLRDSKFYLFIFLARARSLRLICLKHF